MGEEAPGGGGPSAEAFLTALQQLISRKLPMTLDGGDVIDQDDFDGFLVRNRSALLEQLAPLAVMLGGGSASAARTPAPGARTPTSSSSRKPVGPALRIGTVPEHWTAAKRTKANLAAMAVLAKHKPGRALTGAEVSALAQYSGWGGLKIKPNLAKMPKSLPPPEDFGLIHEYYTPVRVYEAAAAWLAGQLGTRLDVPAGGQPLRVLEPSAGIGRAPRAFQDFPAVLDWQLVEYSALSSRMLGALFPNASVYHGAFERWAGENHGRKFDVVVANPPYGERSEDAYDDPLHHRYQTSRAYLYFLRRTLDMLRPGGIGIYVVPTGFMRGKSPEFLRVRREVLRRHHLLAAFRLPSKAPIGEKKSLAVYDQMPTDLLLFQARSGLLPDVLPSDEHIIEPDGYFRSRRKQILGKPVGKQTEGWDPSKPKERRGYQIEGTFTGLPDFTPRPISGESGPFVKEEEAQVLVRGTSTRRVIRAKADDLDAATAQAEALGLRADDFLAAVAAQDSDGAAGWQELHADLLAWKAAHGVPSRHRGLQLLARKRVTGIERFLAVWTASGELVAALQDAPDIQPRYRGSWTPLAAADWLYRNQLGTLTVSQLQQFFVDNGRTAPSWDDIEHKLLRAGWCVGGPGWNELEPEAHYRTGFLWPKVDRAQARIDTHPDDIIAKRQLEDLTATIGWRSGPDILKECHPTDSWVPLELLSAFANEVLQFTEETAAKKRRRAEKIKKARGFAWRMPNKFAPKALSPITFERADGKLALKGIPYGALNNTEKGSTRGVSRAVMNLLGWANIDLGLISPHRREVIEDGERSTESKGDAWSREQAELLQLWSAWFVDQPSRMEQLEQTYNRRLKGYVPREYPQEPLPVARWVSERHTATPVRPYGYQNQAARRLVDNGCGLLAFDTGLGKTITGINTLAYMRQVGRAKRPVVVVPNSIVWKWKRDFEKVLPDYRVCVIGSDLRYSRKKGGDKAFNDTPEQRAKKWTAFQAGEYDVVVLTYSALLRTKIDQGFRERYANQIISIRRDIAMAVDKDLSGKASAAATDDAARQRITERREAEIKARTKRWLEGVLSLPKGWKYDPGIDWHKLGVDFLMVDEAQNFKNLLASSRHAAKRKETKRAWALDFRCASVREHTGGTGVVLLSATPAKNDPVEFYNLLHLVNPAIWEQVGINNHEAWLNRYGHYVKRKVPSASGGRLEERLVMERFKNLDELRSVVYRWSEFKVAEDVGLRIPDAQRYVHNADLTEAQLDVLQAEFKQLAIIEEKLENAYKFNQGQSKDPASKGAQIIQALKDKKRALALRIYLLNIHPDLPGFAKQLKRKNKAAKEALYDAIALEDAPKLQACADVILESSQAVCDKDGNWCLNCGHIVFADSPVVHEWMRRILVARGIEDERIVILNADTMGDLEERYQATVGFNGQGKPGDPEYQPPKYDIVIANAIAYEGVDLQRRTCAIHHLDVPHDPSTLQQRNGRGVRQGNKFAVVGLHYYFVRGSNELSRIERIERKRGWMASLVSSQARETNTTLEEGEDVSAGIEDLAIRYASDEDRAKLLKLKADREEQEHKERIINIQQATARELRQLDTEFRRADRETDPKRAAVLRKAAERGLQALLAEVPKDVWDGGDWHTLAARIRETSLFIPDRGLPLMPGDVLVQKMLHADGKPTSAPGTAFEAHRLGRDSHGRHGLWLREQRDLFPEFFVLQDVPRSDEPQKGAQRLIAENGWFFAPGEPLGSLSEAEVRERHLAEAAQVARKIYNADDWCGIGWETLDDRHRQVAWPLMEKRLLSDKRLDMMGHIRDERRRQIAFPILQGRQLGVHRPGSHFPAGAQLIPPTDAGWEQFVALARLQGGQKPLTWTALNTAAMWWWRDRRFPKGLWSTANTSTASSTRST